jgi:MerR family transcriptional regulator, light-induced transcriptional regulator
MHHFSIRDVENLSGIKAHTLRIWEQRYGLSLCKRKQSQHRYYDNDDLKHILRIAHLYHNGYKISRIATLSQEQLLQLASKKNTPDEYDIFINQLLEASMDYDELAFEEIVGTTILNMGLEKSVVKVFYPFLDKIGLLWLTNHVLPAHEHFSSCLIQKAIIASIDKAGPVDTAARNHFVLFTPQGEEHGMPVLFMQYLLKKNGHRTTLFGTNTGMESLKYYALRQPFTHLYFHLITNLTGSDMNEYIQQLRTALPAKKIVASGPGVGGVPDTAGVTVLRSLKEITEFAKKV